MASLANELDEHRNALFDREGIKARSSDDYRNLQYIQKRLDPVVRWHEEAAVKHPVLLGTNIEASAPEVDAPSVPVPTRRQSDIEPER